MKRTAEIVLTVIGVVINFLMIAGVFVLQAVFSEEQFRAEFEQGLQNDPQFADAGVDVSMFYDMISGIGIAFNVVVIISIILSIIAIVVVRGNRKPKLAGGLLIASTVIIGLGTIFLGWLPALLFLIAGIMCFVRQPKQPQQTVHEDEMRPL